MGLFEKDYLVRQLEQLARMAEAIASFIAGGEPRAALEAIESARKVIAGSLFGSIERLDGASVVALLGREKARAYASLSKSEAEARALLHEDAAATRARARAREVEGAL